MKCSHTHHEHGNDVHKKHANPKVAHVHNHNPAVTSKNQRAVLFGLTLTFTFMSVEAVGGILSGSLALLADAGHMLTDTFALALSYFAFRLGKRAANPFKTYGYMRFEILAGFINALTLFGLVFFIAYEAFERLLSPTPILALPMFVVAVLGFFINVLVFSVLSCGDKDHVNIKGAMLHVTGDLLGSVAVIVASIVIYFTGWMSIDPVLSVFVSLLILRSAFRLLKSAAHILMEGTPQGIDLHELQDVIISKVSGIKSIQDIHVWSITSKENMATFVVQVTEDANPFEVTAAVKDILEETFHISHSTIEVCRNPVRCALRR